MAETAPESSPKAVAKGRRTTVSVRVSSDEKARITAAAQADGLDAGAWLRYLGLREVRREASR